MRHFLFACATLAVTSVAHANLLVNPDFEQPATSQGGYLIASGDSAIPGWNVLGSVLVLNHFYGESGNGVGQFLANSALNSIDLTGSFNTGLGSGVEQTISTVPGQDYIVVFYMGVARSIINSGFYSAPAKLNLNIGSQTTAYELDPPGPYNQTVWYPFIANFKAIDTSTKIQFMNGTDSANCNFVGLDNVYIEAVPEPGTMAALALGLAALNRRRKRSA